MKRLLAALITLVIFDGLVSNFFVRYGLAREGNPWLQSIVGGTNFLILKVVGAIICALILWDIYRKWPKLALVSTSCFVLIYAGILTWNLYVIANAG